MAGSDVSKSSVARIRTELHGKLFVRTTDAETIARLSENLVRVSDKLRQFEDLAVKYNKLIDTLSMSRIANVRHLSVGASQ